MATVQKRRNGRRNNQEETPNKLKRKNSKILEHVTQDETPVSNVVVPMEIEEEIKPKSNGILTSLPSPKLQKEQTSTPTVTSSKKSTTPRKRKAKSEEITSDIKTETISTETISTDQPVMKEDEQSVTAIKKEKRKRNRVLPPRGKKVNNDSLQSQTQLQPTTQPQNEMTQEQQTPPPQQPQPEKSTSSIQISQKTRSPSTQKRKVKALAITGPGVKEKSLDNVTPATSLEEASTPVLEPKEVLKEEQKEINEARKSQKKKARLVIKQKRKRIIKSKETISSGDDDLEDEYIPNDIIKVTTINETPRSSLTSHTKPSKKRNITNGMDNNKDLKARVTRQRKSTNKGKTRGRKKLIRLEDEETERNINKVSDAETIQNDIDEKRDQTSSHAPDNRQVIENNEQDREQTEDVDLPFGGRLTADEADTSRTRPDYYDKVRFENAKNKAEAVCIPYMLDIIVYRSYFFPFYFLGYATKTRDYL